MTLPGEKLLELLKNNNEKLVQSPEWFQQLVIAVNELINYDFNKLVLLLYQLDVSEEKLKTLLKDQPTGNAGELIAGLMVERQLQRIKTRKEFTVSNSKIDDNERW